MSKEIHLISFDSIKNNSLDWTGRGLRVDGSWAEKSDWYSIADQSAPVPHLVHPEGCFALRIVLVTVPRVYRSCEHLPGRVLVWERWALP